MTLELPTMMEIIYRQGKARPSKLRITAVGDCGHVLRCLVLGNYGRLDQVNHFRAYMIHRCLNCQAGDGEQPDHLPLPLQPQLCPRTPGSRRRPSSGAIRWHIKLRSSGFTFHVKGVCHGDELPLLFIPAVLTNSGDRQVAD